MKQLLAGLGRFIKPDFVRWHRHMNTRKDQDVIGDAGEGLVRLLLSRIARVNPSTKDDGIDFTCFLRAARGCEFHVQSKGSDNPDYSEEYILSLPIKRTTIEGKWLPLASPVFVVMSDVRERSAYYVRVTPKLYESVGGSSSECRLPVPLKNRLTPESLGHFASEVIQHQPHLDKSTIKRLIGQHETTNPSIYNQHNVVETLLDRMRSLRQKDQVEAKFEILGQHEAGTLRSDSLEKGLKDLLLSIDDRIAQNHIVACLSGLQVRHADDTILKRVHRNLHLDAYRNENADFRHVFVNFLFSALESFRSAALLGKIERYLDHPDPVPMAAALRLCGRARLRGSLPYLLRALEHHDQQLRRVAAQAVADLNQIQGRNALSKIVCKKASVPCKLEAAILSLSFSCDATVVESVVQHTSHSEAAVRQAVARYLGAVDRGFESLCHLAEDVDHETRSAALRSIISMKSTSASKKTRYAKKRLSTAFYIGNDVAVSSMLTLIYRCSTRPPSSLLERLFLDTTTDIPNKEGIRLQILDLDMIPTDYSSSEIDEDICRSMACARRDHVVKYVMAAGKRRIPQAFEAITELSSAVHEQWRGFIGKALSEINEKRARRWALRQLRHPKSLGSFLTASEILARQRLNKQQRQAGRDAATQIMSSDPHARRNMPLLNACEKLKVAGFPELVCEALFSGSWDPNKSKDRICISSMIGLLGRSKEDSGMKALLHLLGDSGVRFYHLTDVLNALSQFRDVAALEAIRCFSRHPEPTIRLLVEDLLDRDSR